MFGDALGVMLVLLLGGLMIPITLLILAALVDLLVIAWALSRGWHDRLWPAMVRAMRRTAPQAPQPAVRLSPR